MEVKDSPEYKDLLGRFEKLERSGDDNDKYMATLKKTVEDLKTDRSDLKEKLRESESKKTTDGATTEQLKELLKENELKFENLEKERSDDRMFSQVQQKALEKGFVKNSKGQINSKLLKSAIDIGKLTEDDDGEIIGLDRIFDDMRKDEPYMFSKKDAITDDLNPNPKHKEGTDLSSEAYEKAGSMKEKLAIVKARGEAHTKENLGVLPGMGNAKALGPEQKSESQA